MDSRGPASEEAPRGVATSSPVPSTQKNVTVSNTTPIVTTPTTVQSVVLISSPPPTAPSQTGSGLPSARILSRNINGTLVQTSVPQNEAELQLYRVMQRASLLGYYDTLLEMGGDDVQQLCDAGEEEFLEIMALVGMASKPLHVRRLQKALQEWLTNPSLFQTPVVPTSTGNLKTCSATGFSCISPRLQQANPTATILTTNSQSMTSASTPFVASHLSIASLPSRSVSPVVPATLTPAASSTFRLSPSPNAPSYPAAHSPGILQVGACESSCGSGTTPSPSAIAPASPPQTTPTLLPSQVEKLADAAERLATSLRPLDPKPHNVKKKICKNLEIVMAMSDTDPRRMEEIRKYAAIYGRFDCKRKPEKPLTLHEVSVNEAAAQICSFVPALLTRRDELFPLARRVVRDSGYHYSKNQYLSLSRPHENGDESDAERLKRQKLELESVEGEDSTQVELDLRCSSLEINNSTRRRQKSTSPVWEDKGDNGLFSSNVEEISDSDSQFSFSNGESLQDANDVEGEKTDKENENDFNLKVIASRGDNIIAVANPALMNCNRSIKEEPVDEKSVL
ncbi:NGFI-A-binding protein homolog [Leptopilina heterotoma]|uniref:NGFI-A-binding protein homolog n=1 Tax=Leptopilina heterotoma TaxID=63436 RepID=UPI001CAA323C|nr:NGFI-A-binding protein homolog [Leptopilina heterotoma]XP_043471510.1 NGFI-A-binding protein homolog [Leptopilina heterotoma]